MTLVEARWDDARRELRSVVRPLTSKSLPVAACDGLVLAADVTAHCSLPSFDTSAMDGWAVAGPGPWTLVGESLAGRPAPMRLASGECVRIATGATVPAGATGVVRSEAGTPDTTTDPITLAAPVPETGSHVRPRGEECRTGEVLAPAGSALNPAALGLAAAAGNDVLSVVPRPRVTVLMFGDELVNTGLPRHGMVRDSLGPQLPGWLARLDVDVVGVATCEDTLLAHVDAIQRAARTADVVVTTGGTASGPVDHLKAAISACGGSLVVDTVAVRPGHPMLAAHLPDARAWLVGLPGNPQSAVVALLSLGAPVLAALAGRPAPELATIRLAESVGAPRNEDRLVLGTVTAGLFHPGAHLGSGMLRGLAAAAGFAVVPPGGAPAGEAVRWLPLPE